MVQKYLFGVAIFRAFLYSMCMLTQEQNHRMWLLPDSRASIKTPQTQYADQQEPESSPGHPPALTRLRDGVRQGCSEFYLMGNENTSKGRRQSHLPVSCPFWSSSWWKSFLFSLFSLDLLDLLGSVCHP